MSAEASPQIELAAAISLVRQQIERAIADGAGSPVKFRAGTIELDMDITFTSSAEVDGGLRAWVVSASAKGGLSSTAHTHVKVSLNPVDRHGDDQFIRSQSDR